MRRILALSLRAILILRAALRVRRDFHCSERTGGANLACLNFMDERDLARQNTDSICAGLNLKTIKFHKAAGQGKI
ncbi:hypothetical protein [uncultured Campylobacter sp.]|uniref:hypothetical protein n=1 Tax=uncultured Campylobacter sp. TaxID=218934 RepID=UPI00263926FF|nr:hypothetical protein [uncultured Campylobacter sp.]